VYDVSCLLLDGWLGIVRRLVNNVFNVEIPLLLGNIFQKFVGL
jgi:hypothetical protein